MDNIDSRWIKEIIIAMIIGFASGEFASHMLGIFLTNEKWELLLALFTPAFILLGLLYVLKRYQKERDDVIGNNNGNDE